jgi:hypothetical protein
MPVVGRHPGDHERQVPGRDGVRCGYRAHGAGCRDELAWWLVACLVGIEPGEPLARSGEGVGECITSG